MTFLYFCMALWSCKMYCMNVCIFACYCGHAKFIARLFEFLHVIVVMQNVLHDCLNFLHVIVVMQNVLHDCLYFLHVIVVMQNLLHDCWYFCPFLQFFNECCKTFLFTFISLFGIMLEVHEGVQHTPCRCTMLGGFV